MDEQSQAESTQPEPARAESSTVRPTESNDKARPTVTMPSLIGAAAGILLLGSLSGFLSELSGERLRIGGLGLSLMFEALGVVLLVISQGRRSSTAGVTLAALGVIPLVFFVFFDARNETTLVGGDDVALSSTIALLVAAGLWLAGHVFGPSRSHTLFLGAALVAVWMAITIQVVDDSAQPRFDSLNQPAVRFSSTPATPGAAVTPIGPSITIDDGFEDEEDLQFDDEMQRRLDEYEKYDNGEVICEDGVLVEGDPTFWECEGDLAFPIPWTSEDDFTFDDEFQVEDDFTFDDEFDSEFDDDFTFDEEYYGDEPFESLLYGTPWDGAVGRFGSVTLAFGLLYLLGGALFDRAGDTRRGTAFFAVASPLTYLGVSSLDLDDPWLFGLLYLVVGGIAAWLGAQSDRRFTAWFGILTATVGLVYVIVDVIGEDSSGTTIGFTLLVVGLAVAVLAHVLDGAPDGGVAARWPGPTRPGGPSTALPVPAVDPDGALPAGPPLAPPPASQWHPNPGNPVPPSAPTAPAAPDHLWAPTPPPVGTPGPVVPPAFDPRPPGSADPLPTDPDPRPDATP